MGINGRIPFFTNRGIWKFKHFLFPKHIKSDINVIILGDTVSATEQYAKHPAVI